MNNSAIVYSEKYLEHELGPNHPETPERLRSIISSIRGEEGLEKRLDFLGPIKASRQEVKDVHYSDYVDKIEELSKEGERLDLDTPVCHDTFDLSLLSAGGAIKLTQSVAKGDYSNGFSLNRPPGHHATKEKGGGFCYFNNIAIAAEKLLKDDDFNRVMIFDFDAHHGNGTQDIFYGTDDVMFMSFHQSGKTLYPESGFPEEIGRGKGEGYTFNVPFSPGAGNKQYYSGLKRFFEPVIEQYNPDMLIISAGFDADFRDPLTRLELSSIGYERIGDFLLSKANELCDGKISFVLEGGYKVRASSISVTKIVKSLISSNHLDLPTNRTEGSYFSEVEKSLSDYWNL